jgi:hypothetical protein
MRSLIVACLLASPVASADPARCYAGTETIDEEGSHETLKIVVAWDVDPTSHEVRERQWNEDEPVDRTRTYKVDAAKKTLEADFHREKLTGSFTGDPARWATYHTDVTMMRMAMKTDATLGADTYIEDASGTVPGAFSSKRHVEAKVFDCKDLDRKVAELDALPAGAQRLCFDGQESGRGGKSSHVIVEQIIEPKRLRLRHWGEHRVTTHTFAIDGAKLIGLGRNHQSTGTLDGKPGAWTGYKFTHAMGGADVVTTGSLGGARATSSSGTGDHARSLDAAAFDCKELVRRRDAVRTH